MKNKNIIIFQFGDRCITRDKVFAYTENNYRKHYMFMFSEVIIVSTIVQQLLFIISHRNDMKRVHLFNIMYYACKVRL